MRPQVRRCHLTGKLTSASSTSSGGLPSAMTYGPPDTRMASRRRSATCIRARTSGSRCSRRQGRKQMQQPFAATASARNALSIFDLSRRRAAGQAEAAPRAVRQRGKRGSGLYGCSMAAPPESDLNRTGSRAAPSAKNELPTARRVPRRIRMRTTRCTASQRVRGRWAERSEWACVRRVLASLGSI